MKGIALVTILALLIACGTGEAPAEEPEAATETVSEDQVIEGTAEVEETVLYPEGMLDPSAVEPEQVLAAEALNAAYFAWEDKEVTIAGCPYIWYGDSAAVESELGLVTDPEGDDELVTANFDEVPDMFVHRGEIIAVRGTVKDSWSGPELNRAILADAPASLDHIEISPWTYNGEAIPADQFNELYYVWNGMEVTVEGYYSSTTTSTLNDGVVVRVDLGANNDHYNKMVACKMEGEIPEEVAEAMSANRAGVQIRGIITGESFNAVGLENCHIVNR